jgi:hypothetical protein
MVESTWFYCLLLSSQVGMFKSEIRNFVEMSKSIDLFLLFPITAYSGFELTILWTEFNRVGIQSNSNAKVFDFHGVLSEELCQLHFQRQVYRLDKHNFWPMRLVFVPGFWHIDQVRYPTAVHSPHAHGVDLQRNIHAHNVAGSERLICRVSHSCRICHIRVLFERTGQR